MASINTPTFSAGGLASGLDTNSIIDKLVSLESQPMTLLQQQQDGLRTRITSVGGIVSQLSALKDAADTLGKGALGVSVSSSNSSFTATATSSSTAGTYAVTVNDLATAAQARSQAFASPTAAVKGGTLHLAVQGTTFDIAIGDGEALSDVALAIRQSGAPVSATVLSNGTSSFLSITNRNTGFKVGGVPSDALTITETSTGTQGQAIGASIVSQAKNASFNIDGLDFQSSTNTVTDAIPGTTLTLKSKTVGGPETLQLDNDVDATSQNLQKFVDAYNSVMKLVQAQLQVTASTDRSSSLAGDAAVRGLEQRLQSLMVSQVGSGTVRTLADLGIKTERDGTLSLNTTTLASAMSRDASAVNNIFADATSGLTKQIDTLFDQQTNSVNGILTIDTQGMNDNITRMDGELANMQLRIDSFRDNLVSQFTAMETAVSQLKVTGNFLSSTSFGISSSK